MKHIFKFVILMFSCIFFIVGCGGGSVPNTSSNISNPANVQINRQFPSLGSHFAYVTGNEISGNEQIAFITRYQISESNGEFINPVRQIISVPSHQISGVAIAPDNHYIYSAFGPWILKCELNNNGTLSDNCSYTSLPGGENARPNFLAVSRPYNKLYITDWNNTNLYSCYINVKANDNLSSCTIEAETGSTHARNNIGIAISDYDGTIFLNSTIPFSLNYILICGINAANGSIYMCLPYAQRINDDRYPGGMTYLLSNTPGTGLLVTSNMGMGFLGAICFYPGGLGLSQCDNLNKAINYQFNGRTFDVAKNPTNYRYLYFTLNHGIIKLDLTTNKAPLIMPQTKENPSYAITAF